MPATFTYILLLAIIYVGRKVVNLPVVEKILP
jgi:hypothetical protein